MRPQSLCYVPSAYVSMVNFAAMGYWRAGDRDLLRELKKLIGDKDNFRRTDWNIVVAQMRSRLAEAILNQKVNKN